MKITTILAREITPELASVWSRLQLANPDLGSPYFRPEFTQVVAAVRDDVEVALVEQDGPIVGILSFQRGPKAVGEPVGGMLSDYQGIVCAPGFECDPVELIRKCGLVAWDFDHLLVSQTWFEKFHDFHEVSPMIDLRAGYEAYVAERRAAGSEQIKKCGNLMRRMEREIGPLRFVSHSSDTDLLRQVLAWKSQQYIESSKQDLFALGWVRATVERIHATQAPGCSGMLSLLYAGDRLVAGHIGMRSRTVWHYWFPAYDAGLAKYSPGLILLLKMAEHSAPLGLLAIDLGKGLSQYKERLMSTSVVLATGSVEVPSLLSFQRATRRKLKSLVAATWLAEPARRLVNWTRSYSKGA